MAACVEKNRPPSEKLSGVTFTMPITNGRRDSESVRLRSFQRVERCGNRDDSQRDDGKTDTEGVRFVLERRDNSARSDNIATLPRHFHQRNNLLGESLDGLLLRRDNRLAKLGYKRSRSGHINQFGWDGNARALT